MNFKRLLLLLLAAVTLLGCAQAASASAPPVCSTHNYAMTCVRLPSTASAPLAEAPTTKTLFGVDTYGGGDSVADLRAAGVHFVISYLSGITGKDWTVPELAAAHAAGLETGVVFERGATDALNGCTAGRDDAQAALSEANALGVPKTVGIPLAVDADVSGAAVEPYFACAHQILGSRLGDYGSYGVTTYLIAHKLTSCATDFQTLAWSDGQWSCAAIEQTSINDDIHGYFLDFDRTIGPAALWPVAAPSNPPNPFAIYPTHIWTMFGQHASERYTVETWWKHGCENPVRRRVCVTTRYHLVLLHNRLYGLADIDGDIGDSPTGPVWNNAIAIRNHWGRRYYRIGQILNGHA